MIWLFINGQNVRGFLLPSEDSMGKGREPVCDCLGHTKWVNLWPAVGHLDGGGSGSPVLSSVQSSLWKLGEGSGV